MKSANPVMPVLHKYFVMCQNMRPLKATTTTPVTLTPYVGGKFSKLISTNNVSNARIVRFVFWTWGNQGILKVVGLACRWNIIHRPETKSCSRFNRCVWRTWGKWWNLDRVEQRTWTQIWWFEPTARILTENCCNNDLPWKPTMGYYIWTSLVRTYVGRDVWGGEHGTFGWGTRINHWNDAQLERKSRGEGVVRAACPLTEKNRANLDRTYSDLCLGSELRRKLWK